MLLLVVAASLVIFVAIALAALWWYQNHSRFFRHINKIPGPTGFPLFGNVDCIVGAEKFFLDERDRSQKYFPIYKVWSLHTAVVVVLEPEDLEIIMSSSRHMKKSKLYNVLHMWLGTGLLTSNDDKWRMRRKMLTPAFHFTILQNFVDIFNEETAVLVKSLQQRVNEPSIDVVPPITEFTLKSMAETSMGISLNPQNEANKNYKTAIREFSKICVYRLIRPWFHDDKIFRLNWKYFAARKWTNILHAFTKNVINERKSTLQSSNNPSNPFRRRLAMLDLLLTSKAEGVEIDDDGIREEVDTFMFEGHDTTSIAITFILLTLANHKEVQEEVRQEIVDTVGDSDQAPTYNDLQQLFYTERCIKECLRLYPSVHTIGRNATEDILTTTGYLIPKDTIINIPVFDIHRNPAIYPDPEKFDPDRFLPENTQRRHPYAYIPFSAGPRNCIGQKFAMLELKSVLCGILRKFVLEPVDKPEDIVFLFDIVLRTKNEIRVKFVLRNK